MRKILSAMVPFVATVVLFLVLFNNFNHGYLILAMLVVLNVSLLFAFPNKRIGGVIAIYARASAVCCATTLATLLAIECLFPIFLPKEYAQITDLTKRFVDGDVLPQPGASIVFNNADQKRRNVKPDRRDHDKGFRAWHVPGGRFAYYGYDPNLKARYVNLFHWNSHGYYDNDYSIDRPRDVRRIVVIGDSYVEAVQVPLSQSFHKLVEKALNTDPTRTKGKTFQVIALGNSGTGQVEALKVLKTQAIEYKPDAVVVGLSRNDFCDDDPGLKRELVLASGTITPLIRCLASHGYHALAFAVRRMEDLQRNRIDISPVLLQWSRDDIPRVEAAWDRTLHKILEARDFCTARGIRFLLVYLGSDLEVKYAVDPQGTVSRLKAMGGPHARIKWDLTKSIRRVDTFCRQHHIPMVSLLEPLIAAQRETGHQVFGDHYTMFGHQVAARVLSCALRSTIQSGVLEARALNHCACLDFGKTSAPFGVAALPGRLPGIRVVPASSNGLRVR